MKSYAFVDWRQMAKFGLRAGNVPPRTLIVARQPTFWELYKAYVIAVTGFLILETVLIAILLVARRSERVAKNLLKRRFGIEQVISDFSSKVSDCPAEQVAAEIENCLRTILDSEGVDRVSWFAIPETGGAVATLYSVHRLGIAPDPEFFNRPEIPWITNKMLSGENVVLDSIECVPQHAYPDKEYLRQRGAKSLVLAPSGSGKGRGALVLVSLTRTTQWPKSLTDRLSVLANIVASAHYRRCAEVSEQETERRFRQLFEEAPVGIALQDGQGNLLLVNPAWCSMFGYEVNEIEGRSYFDFISAEGKEADYRGLLDLAGGLIETYRTERRFKCKNGQFVWGRLNCALLGSNFGGTAVVVTMIEDITRRKQSEEELQVAHDELRQLTGRLIRAHEEERERVGRELHDDIGQRLSMHVFNLDTLSQRLSKASPLRARLLQVLQQGDELCSDIHGLSHRLHSTKLHVLGLGATLRELCRQYSKQHALKIELKISDDLGPIDQDAALCFYRVAQEGLNNVVRHSGSQQVSLTLSRNCDLLHLQIQDFGSGFDPNVAASGLGLASMRERLRMIGGTLLVKSPPGWGTAIIASARVNPSLEVNAAAG
jgi:PAS domain S-box-containing protein